MPTQELLNYIKKQLNNNITEDQIRNALVTSGWQDNDINEAMSKVKSELEVKLDFIQEPKETEIKNDGNVEKQFQGEEQLYNQVKPVETDPIEVVKKEPKAKKKFSSIWIIIIIAIIAVVIGGFLLFSVGMESAKEKAYDARTIAGFSQIMMQQEEFYYTNNKYLDDSDLIYIGSEMQELVDDIDSEVIIHARGEKYCMYTKLNDGTYYLLESGGIREVVDTMPNCTEESVKPEFIPYSYNEDDPYFQDNRELDSGDDNDETLQPEAETNYQIIEDDLLEESINFTF